MKRSWLPLSIALLVLAAMPALGAESAPETAPSGEPVVACSTGLPRALDTISGGVTSQASCSATCAYGVISCPSGTSQCSSQDVDCDAGVAGYVECDGHRTYCTTGTTWFQTSACCYGYHLWQERRCGASTGWYWQNTGQESCLVQCGGGPLL